MQARLVTILLIIILPLFAFTALMAWRDYHNTVDQLSQRLDTATATASNLMDAVLDDTETRLRAIASLPEIEKGSPAECNARLNQLLDLEQPRYEALVVTNTQGATKCSAGLGGSARDRTVSLALLSSSNRTGLLFGELSTKTPATLPIGVRLANQNFSGVVLAMLSLEWLAHWVQKEQLGVEQLAGLVDASGQVRPLESEKAAGSAFGNTSSRLLHVLSQASGSQFQFRSTPLHGGLVLLVGLSTAPQLNLARQFFVGQLCALVGGLLAGLIALVAAINGAVVQPVRRLSDAVARWRDGGSFEPSRLRSVPREIAALSLSFGRAVEALQQRELQLRDASTQQELLMQEIHHRVKNNLQIVASLLNLQANRIKLPEARAEFGAARDRIRALATLHRHLYAYGELHTINMRSFLIELCGQLLQALGETPAGGRIELDIEAPELRISSDQAVPMALIVTEAVSNAAKYAFPGGRSGHIAVRLRIVHEGAVSEVLQLIIEDDGVGISSSRAKAADDVRDGIGTHLIRGFARQLQAKLTLTHDRGTRYVLEIPTHRSRNQAAAEVLSSA